jgi:hypothetical protein
MMQCSRRGPKARAGKKARAPTITTVAASSIVKTGLETGKVPPVIATGVLLARFPAKAITGIIWKERPISLAIPHLVSYQ